MRIYKQRFITISLLLGIFLIVFIPKSVMAAEWFASTTGTSGGDGSINDPWDLTTALTKSLSNIAPGDTLWLRGGTYGSGGGTIFSTDLDGADGNPIIIRNYNKERAIIDGGFHATTSSSWLTLWGLEVTNSYEERLATTSERVYGLEMRGRGIKVINCVFHNTGHPGIGFWDQVGDGGLIYGTLIYGTGLYDTAFETPNIRGSGIYAQNQNGTRYIHDVISFRNFTTGFKAYSEGGYVNGFDIQGNINFDNNEANIFTSSASNPMVDQVISNNYTYQRRNYDGASIDLGYAGNQQNVTVQNNYIVSGNVARGALRLYRWREAIVNGNSIIGQEYLGDRTLPTSGFVSTTWDNNTYYQLQDNAFLNGTTTVNFTDWKSQTGYDLNSTFYPSKPGGLNIFVRPNQYEDGRGHVAVFNWDLRNNAALDLSTVLDVGQEYEIKDAQNYFGDSVASGIYTGDPVTVPLVLTQVSEIVGTITHNVPSGHTSSEFNAFVVIGGDIGSVPTATPSSTSTPTSGSASSSSSSSSVTTVVPVSTTTASNSLNDLFTTTGTGNGAVEQDMLPNGLAFKGNAVPGSTITINLFQNNEIILAETINPDSNGQWVWETDMNIDEGNYSISFDTRYEGKQINVVDIDFDVNDDGVVTITQSSQQILEPDFSNDQMQISIVQRFFDFTKNLFSFIIRRITF